MAKAYFLTESDYRTLAELVHAWRQGAIATLADVDRGPENDPTAPEVYLAKPKTVIPALLPSAEYGPDMPGDGDFEVLKVVDNGDYSEVRPVEKELRGFNVSDSDLQPDKYVVMVRSKQGRWLAVPFSPGVSLVECCLLEQHPGRGATFAVSVGVWDPSTNGWNYEGGVSGEGIDWRFGAPYPAAGARGLFVPRASGSNGVIYECVSLDCESPGPCGTETGTGSGSGTVM